MLAPVLFAAINLAPAGAPPVHVAACDGERAWLLVVVGSEGTALLAFELAKRDRPQLAPPVDLEATAAALAGARWWSFDGSVRGARAFPHPRVVTNEGEHSDARAVDLGACSGAAHFASAPVEPLAALSPLDAAHARVLMKGIDPAGLKRVSTRSLGRSARAGARSSERTVEIQIVRDMEWCGDDTVEANFTCVADHDLRAHACTPPYFPGAADAGPAWVQIGRRRLAIIQSGDFHVLWRDDATAGMASVSVRGGFCDC